jgi:linoleoyl-CoA desaturase
MNTTMNFSPKNKLITWYVGGLNYQVEHHLFPRISHVHYPEIAAIVEQTAKEFQVPYLQHPNFMVALRGHVEFLKRLGRLPDIEEAIG